MTSKDYLSQNLARNYGAIAIKHYGYKVAVIDLRNPTRSDGYNLLALINHYMDMCRENPGNLAARAKAEKYAKILSVTSFRFLWYGNQPWPSLPEPPYPPQLPDIGEQTPPSGYRLFPFQLLEASLPPLSPPVSWAFFLVSL